MTSLVETINTQLSTLNLAPLNAEQVECLRDPARLNEAAAMLDDLTVRCGIRLSKPNAIELGVFLDEGDAWEKAQEQAGNFDAVCIEEMATDDSRSRGGNEYHVLAFSGPDGVFAASNRADVACWVGGREQ